MFQRVEVFWDNKIARKKAQKGKGSFTPGWSRTCVLGIVLEKKSSLDEELSGERLGTASAGGVSTVGDEGVELTTIGGSTGQEKDISSWRRSVGTGWGADTGFKTTKVENMPDGHAVVWQGVGLPPVEHKAIV